MIDVKLLQKNFDGTAAALMRKKVDSSVINELKIANETLKTAKLAYETLQAKQNELSRLFGQYKKESKNTDELKIQVDANKLTLNDLLDTQRNAEETLDAIIMRIPNLPDANVPDGADEDDNIEIKKVLTPPAFAFAPKEHWELAEQNGWIDFERGVKLAQSRFSVVLGMGARLERALINFMLDFNRERGFMEVSVPMLVNRRAS